MCVCVSGVLRVTVSGGRLISRTVMTEVGVHGESLARVLAPAAEASAHAVVSVIIQRESRVCFICERASELNRSLSSHACLFSPAYGGRDCPGSSFDYQMCNTDECPGPYEDFRAQQCIQRSNKYYNNIKHTWLPYEHPDGNIKLSCYLKSWWIFIHLHLVSFSFISHKRNMWVHV